jgi:DNA polymerase beta
MINENIINEFEKLVSFIKNETDNFLKKKDIKNATANNFRIKQLKNVITILKKHSEKITLKNYLELKEINGIGTGTIQRIKEILETGKLSELDNFIENHSSFIEKDKIIAEFESIIGVGHSIALDFYNKGITSIKMLKKKIKNNEIEVSEKVKLGLRYHGIYKTNIPRIEIDNIYKIIKTMIKRMNKSLKDNEKYIFEICGSYRREKSTSNDIDVLISKLDIKKEIKINYLDLIVKELKKENKENDNKPLLVDDITDKNYETKYMGFIKYLKNPIRRIDIRFVPYDSYYSALLYFTGSAELNKQMRIKAKIKDLKLSEYGLFKEDGNKLKINSEEDIFKYLDMDYLEPKFR